jgi:hypothetical protein
LTYSVHAASTVLATHEAVASEISPRRNRCFHSSTVKVVRPLSRTLAARLVAWAHPIGSRPIRSTSGDDGRHGVSVVR